MRHYLFLFALPWLLTSCAGYTLIQPRAACNSSSWACRPIHVCPIPDDMGGEFLSAITKALVSRNFCIAPREIAEYSLQVEVIKEVDRNVGFSYAPNKQGALIQKHFLVSDEGRLSLSAEVRLCDIASGEVVFVKKFSSNDVVFDFEPDVGIDNVHDFSLGQYEMYGEARKSAYKTLLENISKRIAQQMYYDLI